MALERHKRRRLVRLVLLTLLLAVCAASSAKAAGVNIDELISYGMEPDFAKFAARVAMSESGGWYVVSKSKKPCVGAFQFCTGGTFESYFGRAFNQNIPTPQEQVAAWLKYMKDQWAAANASGVTGAIKTQACEQGTSSCGEITRSSILKGCQFGCYGGNSAPAWYVKNGNKCFPDRTKKNCGYPQSGTDGNCTCTGTFMYRGRCYKVKQVTGSEEQLSDYETCRLNPGDPPGKDVQLIPGVNAIPANESGTANNETPPHCVDMELMRNITLAQISFREARVAAGEKAFREMQTKTLGGANSDSILNALSSAPGPGSGSGFGGGNGGFFGGLFGSPGGLAGSLFGGGSSCIITLMDTFENLSSILMGILNPIVSAIFSLLNAVLSAVCDYILTSINNLMAMVCLPVPQLSGPSFSLPTLDSKSCDGLSLGSFLSVTGGYTGYPGLLPFNPLNNLSLIGSRPKTAVTVPVF